MPDKSGACAIAGADDGTSDATDQILGKHIAVSTTSTAPAITTTVEILQAVAGLRFIVNLLTSMANVQIRQSWDAQNIHSIGD
ncbi:MAG: hypothetical protein AAF456_23240 [Planctomycetota bacterium]